MKNWKDRNDEIFNFSPILEEGFQFKKTKQFEWINTISTFSELAMRNSFDNISSTECISTPIVGALDVLLQSSLAKALPVH